MKESNEESELNIVKVELEEEDEESDFFDVEFIPKKLHQWRSYRDIVQMRINWI